MDGGTEFLSAEESVTDINGKFEISAAPAYLINPFRRIDYPKALVTKPGYTVGDGIEMHFFGDITWDFKPELSLMPCSSSKAFPINNRFRERPLQSFSYLRICHRESGPWCNPPENVPLLVSSISDASAPVCYERPQ